MHAALRRGDYTGAMRLWDLIREFEDMRLVRSGADNVSVIKEALHQLGVCGPGVRAPSTQLSGDDRRRVTHILTTWGIDS
jgi:4-hydroxy-tetrahydrodipicolinate synthase